MNFLLVMPRIVNKVGDGYSFPLGLPYISAAMKKAGLNVFTYNLNHHEGDITELVKAQIEEHNIDVFLTGGLSFQYYPLRQLTEAVRSIRPDMPIICGGGVITGDPEATMSALPVVDIGIIGEGEITDVELCFALINKKSLYDVDGLIIRENDNTYTRTKERAEVADIDSLPWPDYDGFELEKSFASNPGVSGMNAERSIFMLGSRSCPYQCSFCFHTVGKKYRQRSLDNFFEELDYNIKKYHVEYVCIADELFSYNTERVMEFCERIKPYNIEWWAQFRVDSMDPELMYKVRESGCRMMSFGLESADNTVLKSMGKNITIEQIDRTLQSVYEAGIPFDGAFIFGDEAETYETAMNTFKYWEDHAEYKINLNTITVFPGCRLYKNAKKKGIISDPVRYLQDGCPQFNNTHMSMEEYADVIKRIAEYPFRKTAILEDSELLDVDYKNARIRIKDICKKCGTQNEWDNIKLFATNFLDCKCCGQKYNIMIPKKLLKQLGRNVEKLGEEYEKIAVWGCNYHTTKVFESIQELQKDTVYPIDVSQIKQQLYIGGRKVNPAEVINTENIECVVIAIPAYYNQIELQIKYQYPRVKKVVDICDLLEKRGINDARGIYIR